MRMWALVVINVLIWSNCVVARPTLDDDELRKQLISLLDDEIQQLPEPVNQKCNDFDESHCTEQCILGFESNSEGCTVSCRCKSFGLFDGDIMMTAEVAEMYFGNENRGASRNLKRWDNIPFRGKYKIPYSFDRMTATAGGGFRKSRIRKMLDLFEQRTCLKFVKRTNENDYIEFVDGIGCSSSVGRNGGRQPIKFHYKCYVKDGFIIHEVMHALGFFHEHSRPDRDLYVKINLENVKPQNIRNFKKLNQYEINSMGSPYDFGSVMQYGGKHLSKNGKPTIVKRRNNRPVKAQRNDFSSEDIKQINMMYNCQYYLSESDLFSY